MDSGVHEAVDYVLGNGFPSGRRWRELGYNAATHGDSEPFSLIDFAEELGEFGFGFKGADFRGHKIFFRMDLIKQLVCQLVYTNSPNNKTLLMAARS
jgi:hypothetical protein